MKKILRDERELRHGTWCYDLEVGRSHVYMIKKKKNTQENISAAKDDVKPLEVRKDRTLNHAEKHTSFYNIRNISCWPILYCLYVFLFLFFSPYFSRFCFACSDTLKVCKYFYKLL